MLSKKPLYEGVQNLTFDICYWTENSAKTWLICSGVCRDISIKISGHLLNDSSITAGEPTPPSPLNQFRILTIIPDFDILKTSVNPGANPGSTLSRFFC